jgi:hypothetical protein
MLFDRKETHRLGDEFVPIGSMSDGTHHSNFAGNMKQLPIYMTIGNPSSKIWEMPSTHTVVIIALMPIPIKNCNKAQMQLEEQRRTNREVLDKVLLRVLQPRTF